MNSGATSERVYDALKRRILSGDIAPGEKLEPAGFADELNSSITPVRDALHRLAGEHLVETRTSEGFHLPIVSEPGLRDLYKWNAQLVRQVVRSWPSAVLLPRANTLPAGIREATPEFFALLAQRSVNAEHLVQIGMVNDRLSAARVAESRVLPNLEGELRDMAVVADAGNTAALLKQLAAYHRRRDQSTPAIVRALYRS